jgi:2-polyprenyl-6-methoxyphenol hydroxylase-like FAD-dependent oxidoreductase
MAAILVLGGGVIGLSTAMMLTRQGHRVTVFERDSAPLPGSPEEAWQAWDRRGVAQVRQAHYLQPAAGRLLDPHLPGVKEALLRAGCTSFDALSTMPGSITDRTPREGDHRFITITGRRPAIEYAFASVADGILSVRRGTSVVGLLTGPSASKAIPHVTGVRTLDGEEVSADLIIDATGRGSKLLNWLEAIGARRPVEEAEDSGFIYYTRFFRSTAGMVPACRSALLTVFHSFSLLTLPSDAGTWSVTVFISSGDQALKKLRHPKQWTALVAACPLHAHWLDGVPITDVLPMGGIIDRYRRFVVDGVPVATGILGVGDSWACTNPSIGRGITMGLMHAHGTAEVVRVHLDNPLELAHDSMTETRVTPWYRNTIDIDRARIARFNASIEGRPEPQPTDPAARLANAFLVAMGYDADLFRAAMEIRSLLALPQEVMARPGVVDRIMEVASTQETGTPPGRLAKSCSICWHGQRRKQRCYKSTASRSRLRITALADRCCCSTGGPTPDIFGATRSHSSSGTASVQSRRTCVALGALIARRNWPRMPCPKSSTTWLAFLTR